MKPYGSKKRKTEHATVAKGHPRDCGGCRRCLPIRVKSPSAERASARPETENEEV